MLVIKYKKQSNIVQYVTLQGHAEYSAKGNDIVCASASSIFITTINAILKIDKTAIDSKNGEKCEIVNLKKDVITNNLLDNMISLFKELSNKYKKNIKVMEE